LQSIIPLNALKKYKRKYIYLSNHFLKVIAFPKSSNKMKRIKLLTLLLTITMTSIAILSSKKANAVAVPDGSQKFIGCTISEEGTVIMVGGRCGSGTHACIANPCY
jgi:hypothetical protein